jgi:CHASE2 domain-containing sensor protein
VAIVFAFVAHEAEWVQYRFIQQMELFAYDTRLRQFMPRTLDDRIVILDIDEKSLNAEGRWPWSRNKLAVMTRQLFEHYKVKVVGFDVAFAEPIRARASPRSRHSRATNARATPNTRRGSRKRASRSTTTSSSPTRSASIRSCSASS